METNREEYDKYQRARKQVEAIKGFYGNLLSYLLVNLLLLFINLRFSPEHLWFFWPMLGWGIGVVFHGAKVFNWFPFMNKEWEERKIKEFMEEEKRNQNKYN